jgi:hypothetical protein
LCRLYLKKLQDKGLFAHEPWELELEAWANELRLRFDPPA